MFTKTAIVIGLIAVGFASYSWMLSSSLGETNATLAQRQKENATLSRDLESARANVADLNERLNAESARVLELAAQISALKTSESEAAARNAQLLDRIAQLNDRVEELSLSLAAVPREVSVEYPLCLYGDLPDKFKERVNQAANLFLIASEDEVVSVHISRPGGDLKLRPDDGAALQELMWKFAVIENQRREDWQTRERSGDYKVFESLREANEYFRNTDPSTFTLGKLPNNKWYVVLSSQAIVRKYKYFQEEMESKMEELGAINMGFDLTNVGP